MIFKSVSDWLLEQEHKKKPAVFLLEWLSIFVFASLFLAFLFQDLQTSVRSTAVISISMLYACGFVYIRLFPLTKCKKCKSSLPLVRKEVSRRRARDMETCLEIEHGGEEYWGHFINLYYRIYHVDIVRFRCRRCHATWDEMERVPTADYKMIRRINIKD